VGAEQHYLFEARQMQALSLSVHIPLVCFGIAFPVLVLFAEWRYLRTGDSLYRVLAKRWSRIMLALFAVGVVTGTILSFELGMLWPQWMADFGNVFGLGFTLEGFSFFVEAIFIGIYAYGWERLSPRFHFACGIPVAIAGVAGSFFVISVNAWMNHPSGFILRDGRAVDVHPWRALFANPMFFSEYVHMYFAAYIVCGFLMASAYAWAFLRGRRGRYERTALSVSLGAASVAAPLQVIVGDWAARDVAAYQPVKLAAMEGLATSTKGASEHLLGWYNGHAVVWGIEVPRLLSILAYHNPNATVQGLDIVPLADQPPVNVVRVAFQTMVGIGTLLALIGLVYLFLRLRPATASRALPRWLLWAVLGAGPLSVVALIAGWITTEVGRQPWIVYDVMRVSSAVTGAGGIPVGYGTLSVVYLALAVIVFAILRRLARVPLPAGLATAGTASTTGTASADGLTDDGLCSGGPHLGRDDGVHPARGGRLRRWPVDAAGHRPGRAQDAGPGTARDGPGVGGQPRLADLRPGRVLDRVPGGVRVDSLDARHPADGRRGRDHLPGRRLRAARPGHVPDRGGHHGALVRADPV
jgi:cytochrome d ubiquinol oxidase subunit I